jgi:hypothetical protein
MRCFYTNAQTANQLDEGVSLRNILRFFVKFILKIGGAFLCLLKGERSKVKKIAI